MTITVTVDDSGRLTIPEEARAALGVAEGGEVDVEIVRDNGWATVNLRSHIPQEDAWLHTQENIEGIKRAEADYTAGRYRRMSEADLRALADVADEPPGDD